MALVACSSTPVPIEPPLVTGCRVVDTVGTTSGGPTGVNPAYTSANGGAGQPPASGDISDTNPGAVPFWDFDYAGLNTGVFNEKVQLTDAGGRNAGNPVVLMSAGHDYGGADPCNEADTFRPVLECSVNGQRMDFSLASTQVAEGVVKTEWATDEPGVVEVLADGRLSARGENGCARIGWLVSSSDTTLVRVDADFERGAFAACVDSGGVDTSTRAQWLPTGDVDGNFPGLPSGPPAPGVGDVFDVTFVVNTGEGALAAYAAATEYDQTVLSASTASALHSISRSTQTGLAGALAVNNNTPGHTRWNEVATGARPSGIFDLGGQSFVAERLGSTMVGFTNEVLADYEGCNLWVGDTCMPFATVDACGAVPLTGYGAIAASAEVEIK